MATVSSRGSPSTEVCSFGHIFSIVWLPPQTPSWSLLIYILALSLVIWHLSALLWSCGISSLPFCGCISLSTFDGSAYWGSLRTERQAIAVGGVDWSTEAFPVALLYRERTSKTSSMFGRASNSLGPGPWELFPEALYTEKEHCSFSKTRHMLGRTGNGLKPGPWGSSGFRSGEPNSFHHMGKSYVVISPMAALFSVCNVLEIPRVPCSSCAALFD